uniref:mannan endo-1,4-beta-mannosidase n=1 Tax=Leersia perrieri TaxID=77586 RepID=A0A0D9V3T4_9ORYZ
MRLLGAHRLALLVTLACVVVGREANAAVGGGDGFVRAQGTRFVLNGSPYYANGFNAYWLMSLAADPAQRGKVTSALSAAAAHGLSVARTWAFSDGGAGALQNSPGNYNENTFKGLDFVLSEARKYGIKVILGLVDNYDSFGGRKQYVNWARAQGQSIGSDDEFFTNPVVKGFYKNHIKTVLTRRNTITGVAYRDDPTIMAWELMNEPRCQSDLSGRTIQSWIAEMAAHVKSIDRNHMLEVGLEGFYGATTPLSSKNDQEQQGFMGRWLDAHIADAQQVLRKPLLIAEFGKSWKDPGYSSAQRDALYGMVYAKIYASARGGGAAAGGLFWQLMAPGMDSYRDGYEVVFGEAQSASTAGVITTQSRRLRFLTKSFARARGKGGAGGN